MAIQQSNAGGSLAIMNEYPKEKYNLLIPVKTIQEISPLHRVVINQVSIDPDEKAGKDVYPTEGGLALTKKGLAKLMIGANIQLVDSRAAQPQGCQRCIEMAKATMKAARCGDCPSRDDVAWQVTIAVPEPSGTWRMVKGSKELRMDDERARMSEKQFKQFYAYRTEHAETKALNRALREALAIKSSYQAGELAKPFVVAYVAPNYADPNLRKAMADRMANYAGLFQRPHFEELGAGPAPQTIEAQVVTVVDADDDEPPFMPQDGPEPAANVIACIDCGEIIMPSPNGFSPEQIRDYSEKRFGAGVVLCPPCQKERVAKAKAAQAPPT